MDFEYTCVIWEGLNFQVSVVNVGNCRKESLPNICRNLILSKYIVDGMGLEILDDIPCLITIFRFAIGLYDFDGSSEYLRIYATGFEDGIIEV